MSAEKIHLGYDSILNFIAKRQIVINAKVINAKACMQKIFSPDAVAYV